MIWIGYTTRYREGGERLAQAARTLARERGGRCEAVESKADFVRAMAGCSEIKELHLIGHSGMYGPMFGTTALPEQFSPHEWRELSIPFASGGQAWFHACRSGRWFAPFFARTFGVPSHGHHWYTTVSRDPERYRWVAPWLGDDVPVHVVGQPGRKSHGLAGSAGKHLGLLPPRPLLRFTPEPGLDGPAYDRVASLYDRTFQDIRVRGPEWRWIDQRVADGARLLDVGCGTGALLRALGPRLSLGAGVDASPEVLARAQARDTPAELHTIAGPVLPFPDDHFDHAVSLLSWRYLDWDPMLSELVRVLRPGGRLLVVDMVASPASPREWPVVARHKLRERRHRRGWPDFAPARAALVGEPAWADMLRYNPIRAEHEYRWYFESRFPGQALQILDVARNTRVVAFDTGPIDSTWFPPQSYP